MGIKLIVLLSIIFICSCENKQQTWYNKGIDCESKNGVLNSKCMNYYNESYDVNKDSDLGIKSKIKINTYNEVLILQSQVAVQQLQRQQQHQQQADEIRGILMDKIRKKAEQ